MNENGSDQQTLLQRVEKLEHDNKSHHETFAKLVEDGLMETARIAALERLLHDVTIEALGDTPETANILKRIDRYFHEKLTKIKEFKPD